ncbi:Dna[CI] antecedent, DciA [compost metagenome]|jgi:hypothetical protein|uniref:RNA-binding protein n=1 Tax=Pseudomonas linyingensis TaxID=915471 RepID=A0A1H6SB45_9PSED|nr:DciA family protein [Pseudomonas linyingensis]SEI65131.1 Protein of unknown function [Pseudomonas linyingensis]
MSFRPLPARAPAALLRETKTLKSLFGEAQRLAHLQQLLESQLQPAARPHCRVATWREGCLLLIVTDGQWATHLRYQQKRLLRQLQNLKEFENLTKILFKIQPTAAERHATGRNLQLSASAADTLRTAASSIDDPQLRAALERLASHTRPPD